MANGPYVLCTAAGTAAQNQLASIAATSQSKCVEKLVRPPEIPREGFALGPRTWRMPKRLGRHDERGAEMVEFAFVVVLLIALLYGIISYGLVLAAQSTVTQAAADAARSGIVVSSTAAAVATAEGQAANDVSWMGKGCHETGVTGSASSPITCAASARDLPVERQQPVPRSNGHVQLRLVAALPRAPRSRRHHAVEHLLDERPPDVDSELVGALVPTKLRSKVRRWSRRRGDERGATLVLTAICMILLLWGGAMGVDFGFTVYGSRQAQAMADTAALDLARYINIADNQPNNTAAANYLNGKLANVATDNGSNSGLTMTLGLWKNGSVHGTKAWLYADDSGADLQLQRRRRHGQPVRAPDLLRRVPGTERACRLDDHLRSIDHCGRDARIVLLHRDLFGQPHRPRTAAACTQRTSGDTRFGQSHRGGLPGAGQHRRDDQSTRDGLRRAADDVQRHDDVVELRRVADHLVGRGRQPGGADQLWRLPCAESMQCRDGPDADHGRLAMAPLCDLVSINMGSIASGCTNSTGTTTTLSTAALSTSLNVLQTLTTEAEFANGTTRSKSHRRWVSPG